MKNKKIILFVLFFTLLLVSLFLLPLKQAFWFSETRSDKENLYYLLINEGKEFQIRYVHSIHLTDVIESYEVTPDEKIQMLAMTYENLSIGLPGDVGEGETLTLKDGQYTLTYDDRVIDSFTMRIGKVDADLAFRYGENEIDLKENLEKGKSYEFSIKKLTFFQLMKGVDLNDER